MLLKPQNLVKKTEKLPKIKSESVISPLALSFPIFC